MISKDSRRAEQILPPQAGFTLLEMLVVVAIIVVIATLGLPNLSNYFRLSLSSASRDLATVIKETYNASALSGRVYRIAYDLTAQQYWAEAGPSDFLLETKDSQEKLDRAKRFAHPTPNASSTPSSFSMDKTITRAKTSLPGGVVYEDLITGQSPTPITEGTVYTHFFPQGLTEQTVIHIQDQAHHHVSLVIAPTLGDTVYYERYVQGAEVFGQ